MQVATTIAAYKNVSKYATTTLLCLSMHDNAWT